MLTEQGLRNMLCLPEEDKRRKLENMIQLRDGLLMTFRWDRTPDGLAYWADAFNSIDTIVKQLEDNYHNPAYAYTGR